MGQEPEPYLVVVDAEYESDWYLTPNRFPTKETAMRHAAGIAISLRGVPGAPATISVKGPELTASLSVEALVFLGLANDWF